MANTRYIDTFRDIYCYSATLFYFTKNSTVLTLASETLWQGLHWWPPPRSSLLILVIIQTRAWIHLKTFNSTNEVTLHQFGAICRDGIFVLRVESVVSNQLPHSDGIQPRFYNSSSASSGSCSHYRGAHQTESRDEATTSVGGKPF